MANITQRLEALENKVMKNLSGVLIVVTDEITDEQKQKINEANSNGQKVIKVIFG